MKLKWTEIDENGHSYRNLDYETKRQKAIEQELVLSLFELVRTNKTLILVDLSMKCLETSKKLS